eukprot:TRINITY_DN4157_c0_g3_i1.p1 TRINITY_DN4157_c0_g3~~TRINITY_DN4157_c0_g3_i1.p1  ORF type:complete len:4135 (-),score=940.22 TRINITY_DN4157_c0_g3_i1:62-12466(-)
MQPKKPGSAGSTERGRPHHVPPIPPGAPAVAPAPKGAQLKRPSEERNDSLYKFEISEIFQYDVPNAKPPSAVLTKSLKQKVDPVPRARAVKPPSLGQEGQPLDATVALNTVEHDITADPDTLLRATIRKAVGKRAVSEPPPTSPGATAEVAGATGTVAPPGTVVAPNDEADIRRLRNAEDAISFFSKAGKTTPVKFVHLNRWDAGLKFRPYDLQVVMRGEQNPEHFVISATGVVHVEPDQPSEVVSLSDWMRESTLFDVLSRIKFFKHYLIGKAFEQWRRNVRFKMYCLTRKKLAKKFFASKNTFSPTLLELHKLAYDLSTVSMMHISDIKEADRIPVDKFKANQTAQRQVAQGEFQSTMDKMEAKLLRLCEDVTQRANVPDLTTQESLEQYLLASASNSAKERGKGGKKMKSMVEAQQEQRERMRALKRAMVEHDMLGDFIRLVDYVAAEHLFKNCLMTVQHFLEQLRKPQEQKAVVFVITISFAGEDGMSFIPSERDILEMYHHLCDEMVTQVNQVTRLVYLKALKIHFSTTPKTFSLGTAIKQDHRYGMVKKDTVSLIQNDFKEAWASAKTYETYRLWHIFVQEEWPREYQRWEEADFTTLSNKDFTENIKKVKTSLADLGKMFSKVVGVLYIDSTTLRQVLKPAMEAILQTIRTKLIDVAKRKTNKLFQEFTSKTKTLQERPQQLRGFAAFVQSINEIRQEEARLMEDADEIEALYYTAEENGIEPPGDDIVKRDMVIGGANSTQQSWKEMFKAALESANDYKINQLKFMSTQLELQIDHMNEELLATMAILNTNDYVNPNSDTRDVLAQLSGVQESIEEIKQKVEQFTEFQRLFEIPLSEWTNLTAIQKAYQGRFDIWTTLDRWQEKRHLWGTTPLGQLDVEEMKEEVNQFFKKSYGLHREHKDEVTEYLLELVKEEKQHMPIIMDLGNKALKKEHWAKIFAGMQKPFAPDTSYTLEGLRAWKIFDYRQLIEEQSTIATGEANLQQTLDKIKGLWDETAFETKNHRDQRDTYILGGVDDILQQLEDHQVTIQTCLASRFVAGIRPRVEEWDRRLGLVYDVIDEWVSCQKNWLYLEYIFSSEDIKRQLPEESRKFAIVNQDFRDLMKKAHTTRNVLQVCTEPQVLDTLRENNAMLEEIQKKLEDYLETKRSAFPRFYFLSNDELLQILSDVRNPIAVQVHLRKCFDNMKALQFRPESVNEIVGMISGEDEVVPFSALVYAKGNVENWLSQIETMMRITILDHMKACQKAYWEMPRSRWYFEFPAQCIVGIDQVVWTKEVEGALSAVESGENPNAVVEYKEQYIKQIEDTVDLVKGQLTKLQRTCVGTLIVINVHARDVVQKLIDSKVKSAKDFEWNMQLRYYWEAEHIAVKMTHSSFIYGYEYLGNSPRLVITPLTDRCYLTLTGALYLNLGGAPQGPAGTGKTESTKDLAKALARQCVVFNCSDGLDYKIMARMFSGLAQAGAWACFDEFNRIDVEVLSVIAQQMLEITTAIAERRDHLHFEGREINLSPNFGVFITMNPGYAGRTELPDNLKALFRPVCMMIPDYALIAEIMFYSEGFKNARTLALKMVQLYKLSSEQLSKQDHYDFGMRAVKSILVMAGSLKRAHPDLSEDMLLIRAMRDSNIPKFLRDDTVLFMALIRDLFPSVVIEDQQHETLQEVIQQDLAENGLQVVPGFVSKVLQLQETIVVRHGVMLVGQTYCGKSVCLQTLQRSLTKLHDSDVVDPDRQHPFYQLTHTHILNPKAVTMGELYGEVNDVTREWTDGILSNMTRKVVNTGTKERNWIVFDGPVDALWIESMNTVLDDNKMLCLVNGERIKIPDTVSFMFEVQDLRVASPATVSRCGMVFLEPHYLDGGWRPLARSYNERLATQCPELEGKWYAKRVIELLDVYFDKALEFLRQQCKEYIPTVSGQLVHSLLYLLEGCMRALEVDDDEPEGDNAKEDEKSKADVAENDNFEEMEDEEAAAAKAAAAAAAKAAEAENDPPEEDDRPKLQLEKVQMNVTKIFDMYFLLSLVWSVGGNITGNDRAKFDKFLREKTAGTPLAFPADGTVYDYCIHKGSVSFIPWAYKVPRFTYKKDMPYFQILVPTVDTTIYRSLLKLLVSVDRCVLINGPTGVGKSQVIQNFLFEALRTDSPESEYGSFDGTFSAQTSSHNLQERMETKLHKKKANLLGAPTGKKRVLFFIDDINMPALEEYGASPPLELLRQVLDQGGFYDRKKILWRDVADLSVIAACGPPGGGKNEMSQRVTSRFHTLCFPELGTPSLLKMFRTILRGFLTPFPRDVRQLASAAVEATVEVYRTLENEMRPTPSRSHYTFNLRDLSKVIQGMLMISPDHCLDRQALSRLWIHECSRVFHDRLIDGEDRKWWWSMLGGILAKHFSATWRTDYQTLLFGDYLEKEEKTYKEITNMTELHEVLQESLMGYNVNFNKEVDLVFFDDAVHHLSRICRIIRQPRGNALLVGVGGSGRQSLTHLAAFMADMRLYQIALSRNYGVAEFREDLKRVLLDAGCDDKPVVFLLNDNQIAKEQFLEDINNVLNTGEVPNLMQTEDYERVISSVRDKVKKAGKPETREVMLQHFVHLCRENLHIVLVMSPIGDQFRNRIRMFPSLVNCMTIDWYNLWPSEALLSVSHRIFEKVDFDNPPLKNAVCEMCVYLHKSVEETSEEYYAELRRRNYTTPTSYLELLNSYLTMLEEQHNSLTDQTNRFQGGLDKLVQTGQLVDEMEKDLKNMQPILEQAAKETAVLMEQLEKDQKIAAEARVLCVQEEKECQVVANEASVIKDSCQADLDKAMPAFYQALEALKSLNKKDIDEVKSFATPPDKVKLVLDAVLLVLKEKPGWDSAKRVMGDGRFLDRLQNFDKDNIPEPLLKKLQKFIMDEEFHPELIRKTSTACMSLCMWVRAIDNYAKVVKNVEPKKAKLRAAEEKLDGARAKLRSKQEELATQEGKVLRLQKQYQDSIDKKKNIEAEMKITEVRLERAGKLVGGLKDERVRWADEVRKLNEGKRDLVGNMILAAGAVAYLGPFTAAYRAKLLQSWAKKCKELRIPVDLSFKLSSLTNPVSVRAWGQKGLPMDDLSVDNATITFRARRWCLMVDPQGQANQWIKNMWRDSEKGLRVIKMTDMNMLRTMENAIRVGVPVLLENVGEQLDPALDPVLQKQTFRQGGRLLLRLGDTDVDYDPNFRLFITTKLPNPHFMPELQIKVTIINFTVTPKGLEEQLLVDVVRYEKEELERQRDKLVLQISEGKEQLKMAEDKILSLLSSASGNILDNEVLINTLGQSKKVSEDIAKDVQTAETTQLQISLAREKYRPVATRGSIIFTVISDVGEVEHMYQYSLQSFKKLFLHALERTPPNDDLEKRIATLIAAITEIAYRAVCRGLFEKDKLLFSFLLTVSILRNTNAITEDEWAYFLRGSGQKPQVGADFPSWMTAVMWSEISYLSTLEGFEELNKSMVRHNRLWKEWCEADDPHTLPLPGGYDELSVWRKFLVLKTLREEKLIFGLAQVVAYDLGPKFTESPAFDLESAFDDSTPTTPIIFVLSSGTDPTRLFLNFAADKSFSERKKMLSLGQDQGPKAEEMINNAIKTGEWVYLQNCHLSVSWMPGLEKILEDMQLKDIHPDFRLWLTSMPSSHFPVAVLQAGIKLTKEPPKGLKANLRDTFISTINDRTWEVSRRPKEWKRLLFSLTFFHAMIQERRKFGPSGWNIPYEWSTSDLLAASKHVKMYLEEFETIPWPAMKYIVGVIDYGGRVTDFLDQRCLSTIVDMFFDTAVLDPKFSFTPDGVYRPPPAGDLNAVQEYINSLPQYEKPEVFGLHFNADITTQKRESRAQLDTIISIQPRGQASKGKSPDDVVAELAQDILGRVPALISSDKAHPEIFRRTEAGVMSSLSTVLVQEVDRFNGLLKVIRKSLTELIRAIKGEVVMSRELDKMFTDFLYQRVPVMWVNAGYPSLKPLGSWFSDLIERVAFLRTWMQQGQPTSFWISGFFFPQGFLTGVLQTHARQNHIPIDQLKFRTVIRQTDLSDKVPRPEIGVNIHGLFLEGAAWDRALQSVVEAKKSELYCKMPVLWLECVRNTEETENEHTYKCPLYKTSTRAGALSTTGLSTNFVLNLDLPSLRVEPSHWILRGVALLCMTND